MINFNMNKTLNQLNWKIFVAIFLILVIGIFARAWEFAALPPGLNPDEASIGVEAYYLAKYGVDRYGLSYPVHLISWGSGQNALYAYMLIPLIALKGINAFSVRLPMMIAGILSIPLIYIAGKKMFGEKFGLIAMFFFAISPWHIVNSRWAVESNIMPFFFLIGFTALLFSDKNNFWFLVSCISFALCLYAYGTAYVGVPVFMLMTIPYLFHTKRISTSQLISGLITFTLFAAPIGLFILVNTLRLDSIILGPVTIPRLPEEARYETMAAVFGGSPLKAIADNASIMFKVLWSQEDAFPWNFVAPFGYFYRYTFPLVLAGFIFALPFKFLKENRTERWFLFAWMIASLLISLIHPVNLTRINLIFTPVILCIALLIWEVDKRIPYILPASVIVFFIGFIFFNRAYHGDEYRARASGIFNEGIIPAIEYATDKSNSLICFTEQRYSLYIYVLLTQKYHPSEYVDQLEWIDPLDPADPARTPRSLMNYRFRLEDCADDPQAVYVLSLKEVPPVTGVEFKDKKFDKFLVYTPK